MYGTRYMFAMQGVSFESTVTRAKVAMCTIAQFGD
jgi:hypothetical protein